MNDELICKEEDCGSTLLMKDGRCWNHSTVVSDEERAEARFRGGQASKRMFEITTEDLKEFAVDPTAQAALEVQQDAIAAMRATLSKNPSDLKIACALSLAAKRLSQQVMAVDIERRLREIEEQLGKRKPKGKK